MKTPCHLAAWMAGVVAWCAWADLASQATAAAPPVTFAVEPCEPDENGSLVYAPMAAVSGDQPATGRFWVSTRITNSSGTNLQLNLIRIIFLTGGIPMVRDFPTNQTILAGKTTNASLEAAEVITLSPPFPFAVVVGLFFDGYSDPVTVQRGLMAYVPPVPGGKYLFPANEGDIGPDEYFSDGPAHGPGEQMWGSDWQVYRVTETNHTKLRPGGSDHVNEDHLGWGVPIRAIADGVVLRTSTGWMNNPAAGPRAFQMLAETDGEAIRGVKVTYLSATRAASLVLLPAGTFEVTIWDISDDLANFGRQITRRGSSVIDPSAIVTDIALDALTGSRLVTSMRLGNGTHRLMVWDVSGDGLSLTNAAQMDDIPVREISLMKLSPTRIASGVRTAAGDLRVAVFAVNTDVKLLASDSAGAASSISVAELGETRLSVSLRSDQGALKVIVWDLVGDGPYALARRGEATAEGISRVASARSFGGKWVTAFQTSPGGLLKLARWSASTNGLMLTPELITTGHAIQNSALAVCPGGGNEAKGIAGNHAVTTSILADGTLKINAWGETNATLGNYIEAAQNTGDAVSGVSIDQTLDGLYFFVGARTAGGNLKLMTWGWAHGSGNCVYVLHGNCRVLYAHFQDGSVDTQRLFPGAAVAAGQVLGRMGNSGSSGGPHTHINANRLQDGFTIQELIALDATNAPPIIGERPMPFHDARTTQLCQTVGNDCITLIKPGGEGNPENSFSTMTGHGMYDISLGIRPAINARYVDGTTTLANRTGLKEPVPGPRGNTGGPMQTLAEVLGVAPSGMRLYIRGGSYSEKATFSTPMTVRRYDYYATNGPALIGH